VYLDQSRQSWAKFQFHALSFPEFSYDVVRPLVDDSFGDASPLMATTYAGGRTILSFTAEAGTANNPKQVRVQAVPYQEGMLTVTTVVYQSPKEAKVPFFKVKQMVDSLQFAKSEKELKSTKPSSED
jgi:competence CoiA-like predicted nuclease